MVHVGDLSNQRRAPTRGSTGQSSPKARALYVKHCKRRAKLVPLAEGCHPQGTNGLRLAPQFCLWTLDGQGRAQLIGALNNAPFGRATLPRPAEDLFAQAVELGVTLEAPGSAPTVPSAAGSVYRGLCGKLWRVPPPAPAASAAALSM